MTLLLPKEEIHWERAVEQLLQQHHTDLQRLWRRVPIGPQAVGIPLMGISFPGDPDEFGSQATFGPYSGSPYSGSVSRGIQIARPVSRVSEGVGWHTSDLADTDYWSYIDESSANDADYIYNDDGGVSGTSEIEMNLDDLTNPGIDTGHVLRYRHRGESGTSMTVSLVQGTIVRAQRTHNYASTTSFTTDELSLSEAEAAAITDYTNLRVRFAVSFATAGTDNAISWCEFEVPSP